MADAMRRIAAWLGAAALALGIAAPAAGAERHGFSPLGALALPADFSHFAYVNPAAPKGGTLRLARIGGFDSTNTLRYPGTPPADLRVVYDRLLVAAEDEAASYYGLLAAAVDVDDDLARVRFRLRREARWHDGRPVTARDVVFTFDTLKAQGAPFYRQAYRAITAAAVDDATVEFVNEAAGDREFVGLVGTMPVHPAHAEPGGDAAATTQALPLGSGPYRVARVDPGRTLVLERVPGYWGRDLALNRGRWNFDTVTVDYYRDDAVALEAFLADQYDVRVEGNPALWLSGYDDAPAVADGRIRRESRARPGPGALTGLVFNLRRPAFADPRVREAIGLAYDFADANRILFGGLYQPVGSLIGDDAPSPRGAAAPDADRRGDLRRAAALLDEAGYPVRDGRRIDPRTGAPVVIEVAYMDPALTRVLGFLEAGLGRLGVGLRYPLLEPAAARAMMLDHRYDLAALSWTPSRLPGRAERLLWGSALADRPGSYALAGAKDAELDAAIDAMIRARTWDDVEAARRRFDDVLRARRYVLPLWRDDAVWIAWWDRFGRPASATVAPSPLDTWWAAPGTAAR